jgi:dephospho-CoA kinase
MTTTIGLTGGIGVGKSTIARVFAIMGIPVYEADSRAKALIATDDDLKNGIKRLFGEEAYLPTGEYNKQLVAKKSFDSPQLLKSLNALVHPAVQQDFRNWVSQKASSEMVIKEAAVMEKSKDLDYIVAVSSPLDLRIKRILKRDQHRTEADILKIIENQRSENYFLSLADYIIYNNDRELIIPQILEILKKITSF